jgi:hypothetical protein
MIARNKIARCLGLVFVGMLMASSAAGQRNEVQQLMLNVEKLSQLKNILSDMKRGFAMLYQGYQQVKQVAEGNFNLHEAFIDGLMAVSPQVRNYHKVGEILKFQTSIMGEYKKAFSQFSGQDVFSAPDLSYLQRVYARLNRESLQNLDRLLLVITASKLRMNDQERLEAIDRIYAEMSDKLVFLRAFNQDAVLLARQRLKEKTEVVAVSAYFK